MKHDIVNENKEHLAVSLSILMKQAGKSRNDICKDLNIKYTTLSDWVNAKSYPRIDKIDALAKYFDVPKSVLTGWKSEEEQTEELREHMMWLSKEYSDCDDEFIKEKLKIIIDTLNLTMSKIRELMADIRYGENYEIVNSIYSLQKNSASISNSLNELNLYLLEKSTKELKKHTK